MSSTKCKSTEESPSFVSSQIVPESHNNSKTLTNKIMEAGTKEDEKDVLDFEQTYKNVKAIMDDLSKTEEFGSEELHTSLTELIKVYYVYSKSNSEQLRQLCSLMLEKGLLDFFVRMWDKFHEDTASFYGDECSAEFNNMTKMKVILWNYSDKCMELAKACHKDGRAIERLMNEFTIPELGVDRLTQPRIRHMMKANLGILHNLVRLYSINRDLIRKDNGIEKILEFDKSRHLIIKAKLFILLAYCINEEEKEKLRIDAEVIEFILKILASAIEEPDRIAKPYTFSTVETVSALNKLASNDDNKKKIVDSKVLPLLTQLLDLQNASGEENLESVTCIRSLAFHPGNKEKIAIEPGLIDKVKALRVRAESSSRLSGACTTLISVLNPGEIST